MQIFREDQNMRKAATSKSEEQTTPEVETQTLSESGSSKKLHAKELKPMKGFRRELTKEPGALQCPVKEILG